MGRPRKNKTNQFAVALAEEIELQNESRINFRLRQERGFFMEKIFGLTEYVEKLESRIQKLESVIQRQQQRPLGRWVPGGPGRPPKDAAERIAAFTKRNEENRSRMENKDVGGG